MNFVSSLFHGVDRHNKLSCLYEIEVTLLTHPDGDGEREAVFRGDDHRCAVVVPLRVRVFFGICVRLPLFPPSSLHSGH